jgi:hypothetical protein
MVVSRGGGRAGVADGSMIDGQGSFQPGPERSSGGRRSRAANPAGKTFFGPAEVQRAILFASRPLDRA